MRATLPDRPGSLAELARECGAAGVNILGLQVFPGIGRVTDELVLRVPDAWEAPDLHALLARAGGTASQATRCHEAALADQPTRYVQAARQVLARPASFPDVAAHLFDADVEPGADPQDVMELAVGDVQVQIRRATPFTATEHARGAAMAELVSDLLGDGDRSAGHLRGDRREEGASSELVTEGSSVIALSAGVPVGSARVEPLSEEPATHRVDLRVDPTWQRRGIGTRLLAEAARLARDRGATEILLTARSDNQAVMPMLLSAGMRGRIRMAGDQLTVRVLVRTGERRMRAIPG